MKRLMVFLAAASCLVIFPGCRWFLPAGDPPPGAIVPPSGRRAMTEAEAEEFLLTSLIGGVLPNLPGGAIEPDADPVTRPAALRILSRLAPIAGTRILPGAPWVLTSRGNSEEWFFRLSRRGSDSPVWSEEVRLRP